MPSNFIFSALELDDRQMLFATAKGGAFVDLESRECNLFSHSKTDPNSISANGIYSLYQDSMNNIWVGTTGGLDKIDSKSHTVTRYGNQFPIKNVWFINETNKGQLILGTNTGVYLSNIEKNQFYLIPSKSNLEDVRI